MSRSFNVIRECQDRVDLRWIYKTILGLYLKIKSGRYNTPTCFSLPDKSACAQQVDFFLSVHIFDLETKNYYLYSLLSTACTQQVDQ